MLDKSAIREISKMKIEDLLAIYDYAKGLEAVNPELMKLFKESKDTKSLAGIGALSYRKKQGCQYPRNFERI